MNPRSNRPIKFVALILSVSLLGALARRIPANASAPDSHRNCGEVIASPVPTGVTNDSGYPAVLYAIGPDCQPIRLASVAIGETVAVNVPTTVLFADKQGGGWCYMPIAPGDSWDYTLTPDTGWSATPRPGVTVPPISVIAPPSVQPITVPIVKRYVALGDSYSSGEGNAPFDPSTDRPANRCHRSAVAYAYRIAPPSIGLNHVACSGAIISDLYSWNVANTSEPAQLAALSDSTQLVTITIGGNDAGFSYLATECFIGDCLHNSDLMKFAAKRLAWLTQGHPQDCTDRAFLKLGVCAPLSSRLSTVYLKIASLARNARIVVLNYPSPFNRNNRNACQGYWSVEEQNWMDDQGIRVNRAIKSEVDLAKSRGANIVLADAYSELGDHGICGADPYINNLMVNWGGVSQQSLHPNAAGQAAMARAVQKVL